MTSLITQARIDVSGRLQKVRTSQKHVSDDSTFSLLPLSGDSEQKSEEEVLGYCTFDVLDSETPISEDTFGAEAFDGVEPVDVSLV